MLTETDVTKMLHRFLRDDLRAGMELQKDTHEAAYQALHEASQMDDAGYGKSGKKRIRVGARLSSVAKPV